VHTYRARYEEARMTENLDKSNVISVSAVQKPMAPTKVAGPHHLPYILAGFLIGLIGASGLLVYLLVFRETLITVESVERIIGVPVLASVPDAHTRRNDNQVAAA
jgi:capsular polysaccharide biosynthesis protein